MQLEGEMLYLSDHFARAWDLQSVNNAAPSCLHKSIKFKWTFIGISMSNKSKPVSASEVMSERAMTGLFSRAFSQPLKLLGQTEASLSSFAVFWCVAFNEGSTQVTVAELTGLSAKTVSRVISQLGETRNGRGWIRQEFDDSDRRVRRLVLSRKGKSVHARLMKDLAKFSNSELTA